MNRMMELFQQRNPGFTGTIALMGHSLGSCILFDLLSHQAQSNFSSSYYNYFLGKRGFLYFSSTCSGDR